MYTHSQAVYGWQVQPIGISNTTHTVFCHRVDCAISISENDWGFLVETNQGYQYFCNLKKKKTDDKYVGLGHVLTWPAVKMAMLRSLCPKKARLLVGKLFSCSALPVARSKIQYLTQLPVFSTAWTPERQKRF